MKPGLTYLPVDSFVPHRGLNLRDPSTQIQPSFSPRMRNIDIRESQIEKRKGALLLKTITKIGVQITEPVVAQVDFETSSGVRHFVVFTTKDVFRYDTTSDEWVNMTPLDTGDAITDVDAGSDVVTVAGDQQATYPDNSFVEITGSTDLDGEYQVVGTALNGGNTEITLNAVTGSTADGTIQPRIEWTGDESDLVDWVVGRDSSSKRLIATNGVNLPIEWNGSATKFSQVTWDISGLVTCKSLAIYVDQLVLGNVETSGANPQTVMWSVTLDFNDFTSEGSGANLLADAKGDIQRLVNLSDRLIIYSQDSIHVMTYVGGDVLFAFEKIIDGTRLLSPRSIASFGPIHFFASQENAYLFDGTRALFPIGDFIARDFRASVDLANASLSHSFHDLPKNKLFWVVPTSDTTSKVYVLQYDLSDFRNVRWTEYSYSTRPTSYGFFVRDDSLAYEDIDPSIAYLNWAGSYDEAAGKEGFPVRAVGSEGLVLLEDGSSFLDNGEVVETFFDTIDFVVPQVYQTSFGRWLKIELELRGTSVDVLYSTDQGVTFTPITEGLTLGSTFEVYKQFCDVHSKTFRIRLRASGETDYFELRWIRVWLKEGSAW